MARIFYTPLSRDNIETIVEGIGENKEFVCTIPYYDYLSQLLISKVIYKLLKNTECRKCHQSFTVIFNQIIYIASKFNIRNEYITEYGVKIDNIDDFMNANQHYLKTNYHDNFIKNKKMAKHDYFIKINLTVTDNEINFSMIKSHELTEYEIALVKKSIKEAGSYDNLNQVIQNTSFDMNLFDAVLILLLLKQLNIDSDALHINRDSSCISLSIPFNKFKSINRFRVSKQIIDEINALPQFPNSIIQLQKELMDPEWNYDRISDFILSDPALTTEILRLVNSPVYDSINKIDKVSIAVKKMGLLGLQGILYNFGTFKILESVYNIENLNKYKEHLFQVALLSSYIASYKKLGNFSEDIYVAALMHDIGKIVINIINPEVSEGISKFHETSGIPTNILDSLIEGYNHSEIGAMLTEKWNFPQKYTESIRYHHDPTLAGSEYKIITYCVYLGNAISKIVENKQNYACINNSVLKFFNLDTEDKFDLLIKDMKSKGLFLLN